MTKVSIMVEGSDGDWAHIASVELPRVPCIGESFSLSGPSFDTRNGGASFFKVIDILFSVDQAEDGSKACQLLDVEVMCEHTDLEGSMPVWRPYCTCSLEEIARVVDSDGSHANEEGYCNDCGDQVRKAKR